ncbi:AraC family transcriptional regulator [Phyllobacterium sp. K27]
MTTDPLSQIISLLSVQKAAWSELKAGGDWALAFPATALLKFISIKQGQCYIRADNGPLLSLSEGDMLMLLHAKSYVVASDDGVAAADGMPLFADPDQPVVSLGGSDTVLCGVHYELDNENLDLLLRVLPRVFVVPKSDPASVELQRSVELLLGELRHSRLGKAMMVEQLCKTLLMETVRAIMGGADASLPGWLGGLTDPQVSRALALMHARPSDHFSLEGLAREIGMSRSRLATRFREKVGMPPLSYLTWWRMQIARAALETRAPPVASLAKDLGYRSESAFGTAFKRQFGTSPGYYARGVADRKAGMLVLQHPERGSESRV